MHASISICITTRNRRGVFNKSYNMWLKYLPDNAQILVVDDFSDIPLRYADHRFESQQGIAKAKNKALSLASGDFIFLVDDDVWPIHKDWWKPYIESGHPHLCLSFEKNSKGQRLSHSVYEIGENVSNNTEITEFNAPNGCMLFLKKEVLAIVGGMDPEFSIWGYEHVEWSNRIHKAGLTNSPFMDVKNSLAYFHVSDYFGEVESSVPTQVRVDHIHKNKEYFESVKDKVRYVDYEG